MGTSRGMQDMQFAGDVAMDRIGLLTPSATPGMGAAKSVGMEV